jgi:hypothetical protein
VIHFAQSCNIIPLTAFSIAVGDGRRTKKGIIAIDPLETVVKQRVRRNEKKRKKEK